MDRDGAFCDGFRRTLKEAGVKPLRLPPRSPSLNAHLKRFWRSLKEECLERMIFFDEKLLRRAIHKFVTHFHIERNHQGLDNRLIQPGEEVGRASGEVQCREQLGGILRYYYRQAA
jgi:putative transposase